MLYFQENEMEVETLNGIETAESEIGNTARIWRNSNSEKKGEEIF